MVKKPIKPQQLQPNPINNINNVPKEHKKSKQQIDKEYYQKNKERKKTQQKENYTKKKEQEKLITQQTQAKYYGAKAIKILMTFGEYTELNKEKKKLWLDFNWTLKDCQKLINDGMGDVVAIMKLEQITGKLIKDFWDTAKSEKRKLSKSWNSLDYDQQQKLIRYWGYEKARIENGYIEETERLERQSQGYLKDIKRAKFHEERGKINCECGWCEEQKIIKKEVEAERQKIIKQAEAEQEEMEVEWVKGECSNCYQYKKVDSESGLCKKCVNS